MNRDLILLYWDIGRGIVEKQQTLGWGDSVVEMVAADLRRAFPGTTGFSPQNLWRMRQFYLDLYRPRNFSHRLCENCEAAKRGRIWHKLCQIAE